MTPEGGLPPLEQLALRVVGDTLRLVFANKSREGLLVLPESTEFSPLDQARSTLADTPSNRWRSSALGTPKSEPDVIAVYPLRGRPSSAK